MAVLVADKARTNLYARGIAAAPDAVGTQRAFTHNAMRWSEDQVDAHIPTKHRLIDPTIVGTIVDTDDTGHVIIEDSFDGGLVVNGSFDGADGWNFPGQGGWVHINDAALHDGAINDRLTNIGTVEAGKTYDCSIEILEVVSGSGFRFSIGGTWGATHNTVGVHNEQIIASGDGTIQIQARANVGTIDNIRVFEVL